MKFFLRMVLYFAVISWLGAEMFFPVLAQIAFHILTPQATLGGTHAAGTIVAACLAALHHEGVICSVLIALALIGARHQNMYPRSRIRVLLALVVMMLAITVVSEHGITPRMHAYRLQAGGTIDLAPAGDPNRIAFERLHHASENAEVGIVLFGLAFVVVLAGAENGISGSGIAEGVLPHSGIKDPRQLPQ